MNHIKIRIGKILPDLEREVHVTLDSMIRMMNTGFALGRHSWRPQTDIYEMEDEIVISSELAGIDISEIHVETDHRTVKLYGIRKEQPHRGAGTYLLAEIPSGYFERSFSLPTPIDPESVTARYADGMLHISLKKARQRIRQSITVRSF